MTLEVMAAPQSPHVLDMTGAPDRTDAATPEPTGTSVGQVPMDRLRSIFDGMFDGVWLVGSDRRTTYANRAMASLLGTTPAELHGRPMTDFVDAGKWPEVTGFLDRQQIQEGERMELRLRRVDGTDLFGLIAGSPIQAPDGTFVGTMLNVSDMTGKRSLDAQLIQTQRLEAIGQFAGGVAHDFNNLLTSIRGYAELAHRSLRPGDPVRDDVAHVLVSADKAANIVRTLLAFAKRQVLLPVDVDPGRLLADLVPILRPLLGDSISLDLRIDPTHSWVRVDPTQLEQVIVNLAINARDAMPDGGLVTITVRDLPPSDPERPDPDLTAGPFVRISVADTGVGMDDATRARIFDPFFSTKGPGKGTGLGLASVLGIVTQSEGQIGVETALGRGTTFFVDLPRIGLGDPLGHTSVTTSSDRTSAVALIVEDDPGIRAFVQRVLVAEGYTVLAAMDGKAGLDASRRRPGPIDVLVTDLIMPALNGAAMAAIIRAERPGIAIVFISGYPDGGLDQWIAAGPDPYFLPKPFDVPTLVAVVARALEAARASPRSAPGTEPDIAAGSALAGRES